MLVTKLHCWKSQNWLCDVAEKYLILIQNVGGNDYGLVFLVIWEKSTSTGMVLINQG